MPFAILLIAIGGLYVYSALEGVGVVQAFQDIVRNPLDPSGAHATGAGGTAGPATGAGGGDATDPENQLGQTSAGTTVIDGKPVANWIVPVVKWARSHGWTGKVQSGHRTVAEQRLACIRVCGNPMGCPNRCAKPGQSNHQTTRYPGGAIDVDDPAGFLAAIQDYPGGPPLKNSLGADDPGHMSVNGN